jgi:predicted PurR-regulated permease PerM
MTDRARPWAAGAPLWIVAVLAVLLFLRTASALLIPIALAVLISYALEPVVAWLAARGIPRLAGAGLVLLLVAGACTGGAYALRDDVVELVEMLPKAAQRAREMVRSQLGSGADAIQQATRELGTTGGQQTHEAGADRAMPSSLVQQAVSGILALAGHLFVIFFLIYFLLISGHHVRNRLVDVSGPDPERRRTTATIIDEINAQIQRYLLVLLVTAIVVSAATWAALAWMGVEHAAMWALLAGIFNSIPYFGPVMVSGGLFVVGLVQGGTPGEAVRMSAAAIVITSLEGWLLTPPLMGKAERMSALAVFLGLLLWTWVWGAWGTVLAVPMLVIIKSVADHVDSLKPVGRLMAP